MVIYKNGKRPVKGGDDFLPRGRLDARLSGTMGAPKSRKSGYSNVTLSKERDCVVDFEVCLFVLASENLKLQPSMAPARVSRPGGSSAQLARANHPGRYHARPCRQHDHSEPGAGSRNRSYGWGGHR